MYMGYYRILSLKFILNIWCSEHAHLTKDEEFTSPNLSEEVRRAQCFSLKREQITPDIRMELGERRETYCIWIFASSKWVSLGCFLGNGTVWLSAITTAMEIMQCPWKSWFQSQAWEQHLSWCQVKKKQLLVPR